MAKVKQKHRGTNTNLKTTPKQLVKGQSSELYWLAFIPSSIVAALFLSWLMITPLNFLYSSWYEIGDFETFIDHYAPQNRHKKDFEQTSKAERVRLFSQVNKAINGSPDTLKDIAYFDPAGKRVDTLFHRREVEHLVYVAKVVSIFKNVGLAASVFSAGVFYLFWRRAWLKPSLKILGLSYGGLLSLCLLVFAMLGPLKVFTLLHEMVFPVGHQWFFYYQDSLMTTFMKAPDLFAYIAALWIGLALPLFVMTILLAANLCGKTEKDQ